MRQLRKKIDQKRLNKKYIHAEYEKKTDMWKE